MRKEFLRMLGCRFLSPAKSVIFSSIVFVAIFFIISECRVTQKDSPQTAAIRAVNNSEKLQNKVGGQNNSTISNTPLFSAREEIEKAVKGSGHSLKPPSNITEEEERIARFREKLPDLEIFRSDNLTEQFHVRVLDFFKHDCAVQTFMTWISSANSFRTRDGLAMESFFKAHPRGCLMILSRTMDSPHGYRILKPLLDRKFKVSAVTPDLSFLLKNTPAEAWFDEMKSGNRDPGKIALGQNLSDLTRIAVLYKYGGVYLDTDFIILNDFKGLRNAVGAQREDKVTHKWTELNNAAMVFDIGHPILFDFLQEFATTYDGSIWGHNGPYLFTRVIKKVGNNPGFNLTILPTKAFYPVDWVQIKSFYRSPTTPEESKWVEDTVVDLRRETYGLHLWNKITRGLVIKEGSVIDRLIKSHCLVCQETYNIY